MFLSFLLYFHKTLWINQIIIIYLRVTNNKAQIFDILQLEAVYLQGKTQILISVHIPTSLKTGINNADIKQLYELRF